MFGRIRPAPSSPESVERYPAKILKDDPLSVYESTLLKLKQGSRLDTSSETEVPNLSSSLSDSVQQTSQVCSDVNGSDEMAIDSGSDQCQELKKKKNPSVLSMFCNYKKARNSIETENAS